MDSSTLKRNPVVVVFSVLAALQVITAGLGLIDSLNKDTVSVIVLVIAAIQAGATAYVRGMVTPWNEVVTKIGSGGQVVNGPAHASGGTTPGV